MQQRVAIARSYVLDPDVLLMDEPFGALDAQTRVVMQEELIKLSRVNPRTVLFITHAVEEAIYLADRVVVMTRRPGRIREIIDVAPVRAAEDWDRYERTEEVMDQESFVHLRTHIWRLLRGEQQPEDRSAYIHRRKHIMKRLIAALAASTASDSRQPARRRRRKSRSATSRRCIGRCRSMSRPRRAGTASSG